MATVEAKIFAHHVRNDGTYSVKIRVYHKSVKKFIETTHYLTGRQIKKHPKSENEFLIKDPFINRKVNAILDDYRIKIINWGLFRMWPPLSRNVVLRHFW
ncbi:hypothetical protein CPT03_15635 [Pedobacter ginsengisoli]|uniref:Arm DNA-binding domain-containing protein n=2 Tax=Pedobacter ginsengisoli TaxID=363852 RepID=A0A2D1U8A7_9SPHI|nr:hypothetical protein CPT03_15635 [Pedobacter ginsengisoli]